MDASPRRPTPRGRTARTPASAAGGVNSTGRVAGGREVGHVGSQALGWMSILTAPASRCSPVRPDGPAGANVVTYSDGAAAVVVE